jgi:hypothetical protein
MGIFNILYICAANTVLCWEVGYGYRRLRPFSIKKPHSLELGEFVGSGADSVVFRGVHVCECARIEAVQVAWFWLCFRCAEQCGCVCAGAALGNLLGTGDVREACVR